MTLRLQLRAVRRCASQSCRTGRTTRHACQATRMASNSGWPSRVGSSGLKSVPVMGTESAASIPPGRDGSDSLGCISRAPALKITLQSERGLAAATRILSYRSEGASPSNRRRNGAIYNKAQGLPRRAGAALMNAVFSARGRRRFRLEREA
jgi:hypothetical protein